MPKLNPKEWPARGYHESESLSRGAALVLPQVSTLHRGGRINETVKCRRHSGFLESLHRLPQPYQDFGSCLGDAIPKI